MDVICLISDDYPHKIKYKVVSNIKSIKSFLNRSFQEHHIKFFTIKRTHFMLQNTSWFFLKPTYSTKASDN